MRHEDGGLRRGETRLLGRAREHFDWALFLVAAMLAVIGVVNLYSATSVARTSLQECALRSAGLLAGLRGHPRHDRGRDRLHRHYERYGYTRVYAFGVVLCGALVFILEGRDIPRQLALDLHRVVQPCSLAS